MAFQFMAFQSNCYDDDWYHNRHRLPPIYIPTYTWLVGPQPPQHQPTPPQATVGRFDDHPQSSHKMNNVMMGACYLNPYIPHQKNSHFIANVVIEMSFSCGWLFYREIISLLLLLLQILDFTDHVWTECFSHHLGRWMHLDPCEGLYDYPLLYEKGWNKKLSYVIAIAKDGVYDVTKRYTKMWHEVLTRRTIITEQNLCSFLEDLTKQCRKGFEPEAISLLEERIRLEKEAIEKDVHSKGDIVVSLPGRLSGDKQWRISRSEYGSGNDGLSFSSCPVRLCVDEHVSKIYNALGLLYSHFVNASLTISNGVDALKTVRKILTDFQRYPFRSRQIVKSSHGLEPSLHHLMPLFSDLLNIIHLKFELNAKDEVLVHLIGHPIKASLALPVALDALDDAILSLARYPSFNKDSLSLPFLRSNRVHSGLVLASGEELPFGIATAAFDGLQLSKWEEPNGARGGWIAYKLKEEQMCKLVAYELMSANDAPERYPMDWIFEGSRDGGSSWYILDRETSQKFDSRFERKLYRIDTSDAQYNSFRFKFLSVRDVGSTSRLQIGSIDLYAENN